MLNNLESGHCDLFRYLMFQLLASLQIIGVAIAYILS